MYFANLTTRDTRWIPPHLWMDGWVARRPMDITTAGTHPFEHLEATQTFDDKTPLVGRYERESVHGGAPYLYERGLPQYV